MSDKHVVAVVVVDAVIVAVVVVVGLRRISGGRWRPHWAGDCCCGAEKGL